MACSNAKARTRFSSDDAGQHKARAPLRVVTRSANRTTGLTTGVGCIAPNPQTPGEASSAVRVEHREACREMRSRNGAALFVSPVLAGKSCLVSNASLFGVTSRWALCSQVSLCKEPAIEARREVLVATSTWRLNTSTLGCVSPFDCTSQPFGQCPAQNRSDSVPSARVLHRFAPHR